MHLYLEAQSRGLWVAYQGLALTLLFRLLLVATVFKPFCVMLILHDYLTSVDCFPYFIPISGFVMQYLLPSS